MNLKKLTILTILTSGVLLACSIKKNRDSQHNSQSPDLNYPVNGSSVYQTIPYFDWADVVNEQPYSGKYLIQIAEYKRFKSPLTLSK